MSLYLEDPFDDPWHWLVIHRDDWQVPEFDEETGQHHDFAVAISEAPVQYVLLIPQRPGLQTHILHVSPDMRPIVFRSRQAVGVLDPNGYIPEHVRITGFGWQKTIQGENVQSLVALYDDGSLALTDDRKRV